MLFTRCPQCTTTFRVTEEALNKAGGRVRCGRCASVFNARAELRETGAPAAVPPAPPAVPPAPSAVPPAPPAAPPAPSAAPPAPAAAATPPTTTAAAPPPAAAAAAPPAPTAAPAAGTPLALGVAPPATLPAAEPAPSAPTTPAGPPAPVPHTTTAAPDTAAPEPARAAAAVGEPPAAAASPASDAPPGHGADPYDGAVAAIVAQVERGAADSAREESFDDGDAAALPREPELPDQRVDEVLAGNQGLAESTAAMWAFENPPREPASKFWSAAAALALLAFAAQNVHHFRADLAGRAAIGPWVQRAYGIFGIAVTPNWDVHQYQILDWVAAAEPNARGQGTLELNARIHNRGPRAQPYPHVHVELKDRWDETVGRRTFRPAEYLDATGSATAPMAAGTTVEARLRVVDPGPDAYGFELDVCVEAQRDELTCGNDEIFSE
jgi:predicted Zn finger-like uncharacterized protein